MGLTAEQFISLKAWDVINSKQGANIDVLFDGGASSTMWNIKSDNFSITGQIKWRILGNIMSSKVVVNFFNVVLIPVDSVVLQKHRTLTFLDAQDNLRLEVERSVFVRDDVIEGFLITHRSNLERL